MATGSPTAVERGPDGTFASAVFTAVRTGHLRAQLVDRIRRARSGAELAELYDAAAHGVWTDAHSVAAEERLADLLAAA